MPRTLFIGDIHGCYDELVELYDKMQISESDIVYATGDLINGGPKSFDVIQFLVANNVQSVIGNHEVNFFHYLEGNNSEKKQKPLFDELISRLEEEPKFLAWLRNLPKYIENDRFLLVHAGLRPDVFLQEQNLDDLTRIRDIDGEPWHSFYTDDRIIFYGHWAQQGLRFTKNTRGLDSGCMWGGHLSGYCLETGELWQARANKAYGIPDNWGSDKI